MVIPDNYSQFEAWEREQQEWLAKRPVCSYCDEPIQEDELFDINGELYHINCAKSEFKRHTEDYIE